MPNPPKPYDWSKFITIDECCTEEQKKAFITVLNDMARDPDGSEILNQVEKTGRKIFITDTKLVTQFVSYGKLDKLPEGDKVKKHAEENRLDVVLINFDQLKTMVRIDEKTGRLIASTLNYALSHELEHAAFAGPVEPYYRRSDLFNEQFNNIVARKFDALPFNLSEAEREKEVEKIKDKYPKEYKRLTEIKKEIDTLDDYIYSQPSWDLHANEKNADNYASKYCRNEPPRTAHHFRLYLDKPLSKVFYYENGNFNMEEATREIQAAHGSVSISKEKLVSLSAEAAQYNFLEEEFKNDMNQTIEGLQKHNIKYVDVDKISGLNTYERGLLKSVTDVFLKK